MELDLTKHNILRGEKHPNAKLTEEQVKEIRKLKYTGRWTDQQLADEFGVKRTTIEAIMSRRSWRSVE